MSQITQLSLEQLLKEHPKLRMSDIQSLKEWCKKEPHLPEICDNSLAVFLYRNQYHIESAKVNIDNFYTFRSHIPEFFCNRDTLNCEDLRNIFNVVCMLPLQQLSKKGYNVLLVKLIDTDPQKFIFPHYVKYILMTLDLWLYQSERMNERAIIFDVQDITLSHALKVNPFIMKKYMTYIQQGLPFKFKEMHFLHVNAGMESILNISRPLMKKELLEALNTHTSVKTLKKFVDIEVLPNELGGKAGPLTELHQAQIKKLEKHRNWYLEQDSINHVDETKRPGKAKQAEDFFGVEGSFKKLDDD